MEQWRIDLKDSIERYRETIVPYIKEGFYGPAGFELTASINDLRIGGRGMCLSSSVNINALETVSEYMKGLISRFAMLKDRCLDPKLTDDERKEKVEWAKNRVDEVIDTVDITVQSFLEK